MLLRILVVLVGIAILSGCRTPPVQEMSDARQAIEAARNAGATPGTSPEFGAAQAAITRAETHLEAKEYARARLAALQAKRHASEALADARQHTQVASPVPN